VHACYTVWGYVNYPELGPNLHVGTNHLIWEGDAYFYAPGDQRSGAYCFCPVCLFVVCLSATLTLAITFQPYTIDLILGIHVPLSMQNMNMLSSAMSGQRSRSHRSESLPGA